MSLALTEVDAFTAEVIVPEGADARTAASLYPSFQALANRTKYLKGKTERFAGQHALSAASFIPVNSSSSYLPLWWLDQNQNLIALSAAARAYRPLDDLLVHGGRIVGASARVKPAEARAAGSCIKLALTKRALHSNTAETVVLQGECDTTSNLQTFVISTNETVDLGAFSYALRLISGVGSDISDTLFSASISLAV